MHKNIRQLISFCIIGGINTITDFFILNTFFLILGSESSVRFAVYKSISFTISAINSYFLNKYFTFSFKENSTKIFSKFFLISTIGLVVNVSVSTIAFSTLMKLNASSPIIMGNLSAVFGTIVALSINFLGYKFFVFKQGDVIPTKP